MEKKLEQLLNSLIERGRVPFGEKCKTYEWIFLSKSTRDLVSKESGLWQFVCENGMIKTGREFISWTKNANCDDYGNLFWDKACPKDFYEYRLIESSLKDESELEDFLLQNIKIKGTS